MPPQAATMIHDFHGSGWQISDRAAAATQATRSARRRTLGATTAIKVSGMANESDQETGMVVPQGRECSDFQAFSLRQLDKGIERDIDPTTTRSLMGSLYPTPGIFSKYWTLDHEPLVEIIQDTVEA